jgi:hypothetical protein
MRLVSSCEVIHAAEELVREVVKADESPALSFEQLREKRRAGVSDPLKDFGEACRMELRPRNGSWRDHDTANRCVLSSAGNYGLGRSACPGNEPGNAGVHNRIEPDSCTDPFTNALDRVIGKSRDIKIFPDVADAGSCRERSRAALQRPG